MAQISEGLYLWYQVSLRQSKYNSECLQQKSIFITVNGLERNSTRFGLKVDRVCH